MASAGLGDNKDQPRARRSAQKMVARIFPFLGWFRGYSTSGLQADFVSGLTVALVLIPQSMAYAQLADLPAYYGLYAAFLPPMVAALFGSSRQLATGPVAIVSLMTATALAPLATAGSESFIAYAVLLSSVVGAFQLLLGVFRLGMVVNFLSHPVVNGFTNAAALIIATSQLPKFLGVEVEKAEHHYETVYRTIVEGVHHAHLLTLGLGLLAIVIMVALRRINPRIPNVLAAVLITTAISWAIGLDRNETARLEQIKSPSLQEAAMEFNRTFIDLEKAMEERVAQGQVLKETERAGGKNSLKAIEQRAAIAVLDVEIVEMKEKSRHLRSDLRGYRLAATAGPGGLASYYEASAVPPGVEPQPGAWRLKVGNSLLEETKLTLMGGGAVVGTIPRGLPGFSMPRFDFGIMRDLLPMAIIISLLGFMEAISIAKAMANRTGQRLDPDQELIGQGLANILGSFTHSYPVSGSFSRSAVNIQAGAVTGLSSVFSSLVVVATLLFFTPLLYHLPQSVLAAIIMMAVIGLLNIKGFIHAWQAQKYDGIISAISFFFTLAFAPHLDKGIMIGVVLSLALYLLRNMKPKSAILSRTADGRFRNAERWGLDLCEYVIVLRFNNSIMFANVNHFEAEVLEVLSKYPNMKRLIVVGNGINELDSSGVVMLVFLMGKAAARGVRVAFSGLNDHIIDVMKRTELYDIIGEKNFYSSADEASRDVHLELGDEEHNARCPLLRRGYGERPARAD